MPLNDDPYALSDDEYWDNYKKMVEQQKKSGVAACGDAPPKELVDSIVADLDGDGLPG